MRDLVLAGAGPVGGGTPWGTIAELLRGILVAAGFRVSIETRTTRMENVRYVADGRADIGVTNLMHLVEAFRGTNAWAEIGPLPDLRVIANVNHPSWLAVAVKREVPITDLAQVAERRLPLRIRVGLGPLCKAALVHYGLEPSTVSSWGGCVKDSHDYPVEQLDLSTLTEQSYRRTPWVEEGDFDVIIDTTYASYTPEVRHFVEASVLYDLRFLPISQELILDLTGKGLCRPGVLPHKLLRGVFFGVPTVQRLPQAIYGRSDLESDVVRAILVGLHDSHERFRTTHLGLSLDTQNIFLDYGVPTHDVIVATAGKLKE